METQTQYSKASIDIDIQQAKSDSPIFRAKLQRNEDQLEELGWIVESIIKASKQTLESGASIVII